jgi:hypothetical protein
MKQVPLATKLQLQECHDIPTDTVPKRQFVESVLPEPKDHHNDIADANATTCLDLHQSVEKWKDTHSIISKGHSCGAFSKFAAFNSTKATNSRIDSPTARYRDSQDLEQKPVVSHWSFVVATSTGASTCTSPTDTCTCPCARTSNSNRRKRGKIRGVASASELHRLYFVFFAYRLIVVVMGSLFLVPWYRYRRKIS